MFGYVKAYAPELRVREAEYYRAVYCGLCRAMRKSLGVTSAAALSYDIVFLILTRMALLDEYYGVSRRRCPIKLRRRTMTDPGGQIMYGAAVSALLTSRKLEDDVRDERGGRRAAARAALPFSRRHMRRAGIDGSLVREVDGRLSELYALESEKKSGERVFGELLALVFSHGIEGDGAKIARAVGNGVGRAIYILDAVDDMAEDEKKGRWNPVAAAWEGLPVERAAEAEAEAVRLILSEAGAASELIDSDGEPAAIVKNILFIGIPKEADRIMKKHIKGGEEKA